MKAGTARPIPDRSRSSSHTFGDGQYGSRVSVMQDSQARWAAWPSLTCDVRVARRHGGGMSREAAGTVPGWERGDLAPSITTTSLTCSTRCPDRTPSRAGVLERIFGEAREHPENLNFTLGAAEVVAVQRSWRQACAGRRAGDHQARLRRDRTGDPGQRPGTPALPWPRCSSRPGTTAPGTGTGPTPGRRRRPAIPRTSSPRSSTATSTGTIRNYPWSPDPAEQPAAADQDGFRSTHLCPPRTDTNYAA